MQESTRSDLHHDEHPESAEARRYRNKEIAQLGAAVILQAIEDRVTNCPLATRQAFEFLCAPGGRCWSRIRHYQQFNIELLPGCLELLMLLYTE